MPEQQSALLTIASKWATPSGLLILFGAVAWGVQLNVAIINLTDKVSELDVKTDATLTTQAEIAANVLRATVLMGEMEKDMMAVMRHVDEHNDESEAWKQRIIRLEERMRRATEVP